MIPRAPLLIGALCLTCFVPIDHALAEILSCAVHNLRSVEAIIEAQRCVSDELDQAKVAADDINAALDDIKGTFKLANKYAAKSDKFLSIYRRTQDTQALAKHKEYEALYQKAFANFETYRSHLDGISRTRDALTKLIEELRERIKILRDYEASLRRLNERRR